MKIVQGSLEAIGDFQNNKTYQDPNNEQNFELYRFTRLVLDNGLTALFQNHDLKISLGDKVVAGGFKLGKWFMIMTVKNLNTGQIWTNNAILQMLLGLAIISMPFWVTGDNPLTYSAKIWLFLVLPFILIGAGLFYFGLDIYKTSKKLAAFDD